MRGATELRYLSPTRRDVLRSLGLTSLATVVTSDQLFAADSSTQPTTSEEWMAAWMAVARKDLSGGLFLGRFKDPMYFLTKSISWIPNAQQSSQYTRVDVPVGFVTDLASIPRFFWSLLRPDGEYAYAAIVHDYLYWTQPVEREKSDNIFKFGMQDLSIDALTISTIYNAVRLGGESSWTEDARLKASGEKRLLSVFPDDPKITWEEWKKRPGVFSNQ
jgi:Protein of unknown function (DUF1353)